MVTLTTVTKVVQGTCTDGDTNATAGSIAKAINDIVSTVATTIQSITVVPLGWNQAAPSAQVVKAIIVYT